MRKSKKSDQSLIEKHDLSEYVIHNWFNKASKLLDNDVPSYLAGIRGTRIGKTYPNPELAAEVTFLINIAKHRLHMM